MAAEVNNRVVINDPTDRIILVINGVEISCYIAEVNMDAFVSFIPGSHTLYTFKVTLAADQFVTPEQANTIYSLKTNR